jgi:putative ABC transport system substrate-binding protein
MDRRVFLATAAGLLTAPLAGEAQPAPKVTRIGYLAGNLVATPHRPEAFRQALRDLGYVEGRNVVIEYRDAEGTIERLPALAAELVALKVDVIVAAGTPAALAAKHATRTVPIVFAAIFDPVTSGLVTSLARPGGNVTGTSTLAPELVGKPNYPPLSTREIQTLPEGARVIVTWSAGNDGPHEYRVHWRRGEPYAQTDEEHRQGRVDLEKWLTYYVGPRRPFTRVWALAALRAE